MAKGLIEFNEQENFEDKWLETATILFNEKPSKGIQFCLEHQLFQNKHNEIADFLLNAKGLSKFAIGEYLSDRNEFNQEVLLEFTKSFNFAGVPID